MTPRLHTTKWLWCVLVLQVPLWRPASSAVRAPPGEPSTIEAQAKFFQDFFSVQLSPYKIEFGHVCEDPNTWEQRYEKKDFENHRDMGKVRWGDKKGGYGEHYWDLNHAGNAHNHADDSYDEDDGSYHENTHDAYDEPSEQSPNYDSEYTPDKYTPGKYSPEGNGLEETNRAKRAHTRYSVQMKSQERVYEEQPKLIRQEKINEDQPKSTRQERTYEERPKLKRQERMYEEQPTPARQERIYEDRPRPKQEKEYEEETKLIRQEIYEEPEERPRRKSHKSRRQYKVNEEETGNEQTTTKKPIIVDNDAEDIGKKEEKKEKNNVVLVIENRDREVKETTTKAPVTHYVPYEGGAGVRQHYQEATAAASAPRLFLEPSTGHIVDRATGQAYVLQPVQFN